MMSTIIEETVELPAELEQAEDEILILRKAHDLLLDRDNWCGCRDVVKENGDEQGTPWDEGVVRRCVLSAVAWAAGEPWDWERSEAFPPRYAAARERLGREIEGPADDDRWGSTTKIVFANDGPGGYERIMAALKRAIS
jgi:hypothetical protein